MTEYGLYLESGPKHRKTLVHIFEPLGCMANGPTTEAAIDATPDAIRAFLQFLHRSGERIDIPSRITTRVVEHITEGYWLGNGSPTVVYQPDLEPVTEAELTTFTHRLTALRAALSDWAAEQTEAALDAKAEGRTARAILLHVLGPTGAYLSPVLGTISGISRLQTQAERGEVAIADALRQATAIVTERLSRATEGDRTRIVERPNELRTMRKALRRSLEHDWEHLRELARRPGGPSLDQAAG
jgi:predicted RNase H-like HicB family nuclease